MNGDYTKVPLRADEIWTGARMQQGRVLLDHEWNLNLDASARQAQRQIMDVVGAAGVRAGTADFQVKLTEGGDDLSIERGHMWVGGYLVQAPARFRYGDQRPAPAGVSTAQHKKLLVYLDVFEEHVQAAEDPTLLDPALDPIDTTARTRIGYRVRWRDTAQVSPREAWREVRATLMAGSDAALTIAPAVAGAGRDPCAPPADPDGALADGLLRVEVLDGGDLATARLAWSFDNGASVAPVSKVGPTSTAAGRAVTQVTLAAAPAATFSPGQLVELSWLERRADRKNHGRLYTVDAVGPGGGSLTLSRPAPADAPPAQATGLVVRRWDGEMVGAGPTTIKVNGRDYATLSLTATVSPTATETLCAGDWWGARIRHSGNSIDSLDHRLPDGVGHAFVQLAYVDVAARTVIDMRPRFKPLIAHGGELCTVTIDSDTEIASALAYLPSDGGVICFGTGTYALSEPIVLTGRNRITIHGTGPSTVIVAPPSSDAAIRFEDCTEVAVRDVRIVGGAAAHGGGSDGAVTFVGACADVRIENCTIGCAGGASAVRTCLTVRSDVSRGALPDVVRIERNAFEVGDRQTAVLLVDVGDSQIKDNRAALAPGAPAAAFATQGIVVGGTRASVVQVTGNIVRDVAQGIHLALSDSGGQPRTIDKALVANNHVAVKIPKDYAAERHGFFVGRANSIQILGNSGKLDLLPKLDAGAADTKVYGVRLKAPTGPMLLVRDTALDGFKVGVGVTDVDVGHLPQARVWLVEGTMAANGDLALEAPDAVAQEHNAPQPAPTLTGIQISPTQVSPGSTATGTITLGASAPQGSTVEFTLEKANAADVDVLQPIAALAVPAGATSAPFTVAAKPQQLQNNTVVTVRAKLKAGDTQSEAHTSVTVLPTVTTGVAALSLSASSVSGGATVTGTVTLTRADPTAVVTLTGKSGVAMPTQDTLQVPSGTTATFSIATHAHYTDQVATITASIGSSQKSATLTVKEKARPKLDHIRVFYIDEHELAGPGPIEIGPDDRRVTVVFDTGNPVDKARFFANKAAGPSIQLDYTVTESGSGTNRKSVRSGAVPNVIELGFQGAELDPSTVTPESVVVENSSSGVAQPSNARIVRVAGDPQRFCWVADALPTPVLGLKDSQNEVTYTVTLRGDLIAATNGRKLNGNLVGLPSGDGNDGASAVFTISLRQMRKDLDTRDDAERWETNRHVYDPATEGKSPRPRGQTL